MALSIGDQSDGTTPRLAAKSPATRAPGKFAISSSLSEGFKWGIPGQTSCWRASSEDHERVARDTLAALRGPFARLIEVSTRALRDGNKFVFFGNGRSAADAQHLATGLTVRFEGDRPAIPTIALTTDSSTLTAIGNDLGFDRLFSRQIEALGRPGDVAIGITTSGRSRNVVLGLTLARDRGLVAAAFAGRDGSDLPGLADPLLIVPSNVTSRIQGKT